jgi:hypothetical protein
MATPPPVGTRVLRSGAAAAGTRVGTALVAVGDGVVVAVTVAVGVEVFVSVGTAVPVGAGVLVGPVVGVTVVVKVATTPISDTSATDVPAWRYGPEVVPAQIDDWPAEARLRVSGRESVLPNATHAEN